MPKALGSELTKFYKEGFPDGYFHDDYNEDIDPDNFVPTEKYDLNDLGWIISESGNDERSFGSVFRKWEKQQTTASFIVEVPKEQLDEAKAAVKNLGLKVS